MRLLRDDYCAVFQTRTLSIGRQNILGLMSLIQHISCPDCVAKAAAIIVARPESEEPQRPSIADLE